MSCDSYHHKDIKNRLLELAIKKLEEVGVENLSIRELARDLGVSKNAPYRHFRNKDELLAAIANFGFIELTRMMEDGISAESGFRESLESMGNRYIDFSRLYPSIYRFMFSMTKSEIFYTKYDENASKAFLILSNQIEKAIDSGLIKQQDAFKTALSVWAYIHGCASFYVDSIGLPFGLSDKNIKIFSVDMLLDKL